MALVELALIDHADIIVFAPIKSTVTACPRGPLRLTVDLNNRHLLNEAVGAVTNGRTTRKAKGLARNWHGLARNYHGDQQEENFRH
jgi:hypothetical protein